MTELKTARYRVRRWTAFTWSDDMERNQREDHLTRMAQVIEHKMIDAIPRFEPSCRLARVDGQPQLLFELTLLATDENDARRRAMYRIDRALSAKVPDGRLRRGKVRLEPPWGEARVEEEVAA